MQVGSSQPNTTYLLNWLCWLSRVTFTGFRPLSADFGYCCWILAMEAKIQHQWLDSDQFRRNLAQYSWIPAKVAGIRHKLPDVDQFRRNLVNRNSTTVVGRRRVLAQIARFRHQSNSRLFCQNLVTEFRLSDTKTRGPSSVDLGHQQTTMPGGDGFS
jgi:hypothetical protein